ncbi:MAG: aspartate-semialdehyde dehydrogenase [Clostridia bacterium]|nr:aspartate-semialdehyde dehydrogenase [Clostridia bacterium]
MYNIAVVGATGLIGRNILEILSQRNFPVKRIVAFASKDSVGKIVKFGSEKLEVLELTEENIARSQTDIALFSAGGDVSKRYAPVFATLGAVVVDNSSAWRMNEGVPLVIPAVNPASVTMHSNIIANPNCSTIAAVVALAPLHKKFGLKRVVYSTYQAVSGAGMQGIYDLQEGTTNKFPKPICHNVIPLIDKLDGSGYTLEEQKMINETKKILGNDRIFVTATCVRVPVYVGHAISINAEFYSKVTVNEVENTLKSSPGITLSDLPTPLECSNGDTTYVGRIRRDEKENAINMWVVADNLRRGAATNAVEIAELLIQ